MNSRIGDAERIKSGKNVSPVGLNVLVLIPAIRLSFCTVYSMSSPPDKVTIHLYATLMAIGILIFFPVFVSVGACKTE
jgi:hypothetical protein